MIAALTLTSEDLPENEAAPFDLAPFATDIAAMRIEQDAYAAECQAYRRRLAHALGLLDTAEKLRVIRVEQLTAAEGRLADAIGASVDALNAAEAAGQTVPHGHWHLIPRFVDDPVNWPWPHAEYSGDELGQMQFRITSALG